MPLSSLTVTVFTGYNFRLGRSDSSGLPSFSQHVFTVGAFDKWPRSINWCASPGRPRPTRALPRLLLAVRSGAAFVPACIPPPRRSRTRLCARWQKRSEEHTSELQSLMRISYAVFCLKKKKKKKNKKTQETIKYNGHNTKDRNCKDNKKE